MSYVNINTLEKVEAIDIMMANPHISFPNRGWSDEELAPYGYAELNFPVEHPIPGLYETLVEAPPVNIDGKWYIQFSVVPMSKPEIEAKKEQILADIIAGVQNNLDSFAKTRNYDGILSLCTYATSTNPTFKAEGERGVYLRDETWNALYVIMAEVKAGKRPHPTGFGDVVGELPELTWQIE